MPALMKAPVAALALPRPAKIPPIIANAEVTATSSQRCTRGEIGLGARSKMSTVFSGAKFIGSLLLRKEDAHSGTAVGEGARRFAQHPTAVTGRHWAGLRSGLTLAARKCFGLLKLSWSLAGEAARALN